jgi:hypothetical protein
VYALGMNLSLCYGGTWGEPALDAFEWLCRDAGLVPPRYHAGRDVWIGIRKAEKSSIWFIFNLSDEAR